MNRGLTENLSRKQNRTINNHTQTGGLSPK